MEIRIDLGLGQTAIKALRGTWKDTEKEFVAISFKYLSEPQPIGLSVLNKDVVVHDASVIILSHNKEGLIALKNTVEKAIELFAENQRSEKA